MAALKPLELTKEERTELEILARSRRDWRTRDRSRTILMFSNGVPAKEIARRQELTLEAVPPSAKLSTQSLTTSSCHS